jgi:regulatory protein
LRAKLRRACDDQALIERVLDALAVERLQSDERHAEAYARQRAGRGYGPLRIAQELRERGVSKELGALAIEAASTDWLASARSARTRRFGSAPPSTAAARAAQMRFLQYRGFPSDIIRQCLVGGGDDSTSAFEQ